MTNIVANICKNGDNSKPVAGFIRVVSRSTSVDSTRFYVSDAVDYPLVNGSVSFDLNPSEVSKIAYSFEIWQIIDPALNENEKLYSFDAVVPDSLTPISFNLLAQQSGLRYDQRDASLLTLAKYILSNDIFSDYVLSRLLRPTGFYLPSRVYKRGDCVIYNGSGYIYIGESGSGNPPTNLSYWVQYVAGGADGSGTTGSVEPYGVSWLNQTDAPSRGTVYNAIEGRQPKSLMVNYAPIVNAVLSSPSLNPATPLLPSDNSQRLANTAWVQASLYPALSQIPVGARVKWDGGALPVKYIRADGVPRAKANYPQLYAIYGTLYGAETTTTFSTPNDPGFIIFTG